MSGAFLDLRQLVDVPVSAEGLDEQNTRIDSSLLLGIVRIFRKYIAELYIAKWILKADLPDAKNGAAHGMINLQ
jgi:hypothetical protein